MIDLFAMGMEIDRAYGGVLRDQCSVDFVRGGPSPYDYPIVGFDEDGEPYVELESLEWHQKRRIRLGSRLTELEKAANPRLMGEFRAGTISDRIERAVAELREPPPLWVDP